MGHDVRRFLVLASLLAALLLAVGVALFVLRGNQPSSAALPEPGIRFVDAEVRLVATEPGSPSASGMPVPVTLRTTLDGRPYRATIHLFGEAVRLPLPVSTDGVSPVDLAVAAPDGVGVSLRVRGNERNVFNRQIKAATGSPDVQSIEQRYLRSDPGTLSVPIGLLEVFGLGSVDLIWSAGGHSETIPLTLAPLASIAVAVPTSSGSETQGTVTFRSRSSEARVQVSNPLDRTASLTRMALGEGDGGVTRIIIPPAAIVEIPVRSLRCPVSDAILGAATTAAWPWPQGYRETLERSLAQARRRVTPCPAVGNLTLRHPDQIQVQEPAR